MAGSKAADSGGQPLQGVRGETLAAPPTGAPTSRWQEHGKRSPQPASQASWGTPAVHTGPDGGNLGCAGAAALGGGAAGESREISHVTPPSEMTVPHTSCGLSAFREKTRPCERARG